MTLVDLVATVVVALAFGLVAGKLVTRRSRGGVLIASAIALVGAILGGAVAHSVGAPEPAAGTIGGHVIPLLWWAIGGAALATLGAAWLQRAPSGPRPV